MVACNSSSVSFTSRAKSCRWRTNADNILRKRGFLARSSSLKTALVTSFSFSMIIRRLRGGAGPETTGAFMRILRDHCNPRHAAVRALKHGWHQRQSHQPKLPELAAERFRHHRGALRSFAEIARRVARRKIAPALESAMRPRLDQNQFGVEHDAAAAHSVVVDERPDRPHLLAANDFAADDPIERSTLDQLLGALGHHARTVNVFRLLAFPAFGL